MNIMVPIKNLKNFFNSIREKRRIKFLKNYGMYIGENVTIMPGVDFDYPYSHLIVIGDNCSISKDVRFIAHDATTYKYLGYTLVHGIKLERNVFIGDKAILLPGITIGKNSIVAAGSVVNKNIPEGKVAAGNPARIYNNFIDYLNERLSKISTCPVVKEDYFFSNVYKNTLVNQSQCIYLSYSKKRSDIYGGSPDLIQDSDLKNIRDELGSFD